MLSLREAIDALLKYAVQNHTEHGKDCEQIASYLGELEHARTRIKELEQELNDAKTAWMREMNSNGARIRRMSNAEMAKFLNATTIACSKVGNGCKGCPLFDGSGGGMMCGETAIKEWLDKEVKTES